MGPSCMEASLSASRRCHRNLISHRRLWAPSMRIYVVFTQRESKAVIKNEGKKTHSSSYTHGRKMTTFHLEIQKLQSERGEFGARVSFGINNSFYLIMHFQKLALLIKMVSSCSQVLLRPCRALFHRLLCLKSSVPKCFKFTPGKGTEKLFPKHRESVF